MNLPEKESAPAPESGFRRFLDALIVATSILRRTSRNRAAKPIVLKGNLSMFEQDCGHSYSGIFIGNQALDKVLWSTRCAARGLPPNSDPGDIEDYGQVHLTIEFLEKGP